MSGSFGSASECGVPTYRDAPVLPQVPVEARDAAAFSINFQLGPAAGTRTTFQTPIGERMVQIQGDRVVLNWQRTVDAPEYPGYDVLRPEMIDLFQHLRATCTQVGGSQPQASQVEVHYVNPISRSGEGPEHASGLLAPWGGETSTGFLPTEEEVRVDVRYPITDGTGGFLGRLYVNAGPAVAAAPGQALRSVYLLQLFARVLPVSPDTVQLHPQRSTSVTTGLSRALPPSRRNGCIGCGSRCLRRRRDAHRYLSTAGRDP